MNDITDETNGYYYRLKDNRDDRFICQYMRLDYLIQLLETQYYYANRRKNFNDAKEINNEVKMIFNPKSVWKKNKYSPKAPERTFSYKQIENCPTACWSKNKREDFLIWKCYATEIGACIKSTVYKVIDSIKIRHSKESNNWIICGSMDYTNIKPSLDVEKQLFDKDKAYSSEKEFRFYFHLPSCDTNDNASGILIPVNTNVMIDEIILSPFIRKETANSLARMIKKAYNIEVKQSSIKLKL